MKEKWKAISGYEGRYEVSNFGCVRSLDMKVTRVHGKAYSFTQKGRELKAGNDGKGYSRICLSDGNGKKFFYVHRLVALAFVEGYADGLQVNHIDENKANNRADNLEWVSVIKNINHGTHNRRMATTKGRKVAQVNLENEIVATFVSLAEAHRVTGISRENIGNCCNGRKGYVTAGGYKWRFV